MESDKIIKSLDIDSQSYENLIGTTQYRSQDTISAPTIANDDSYVKSDKSIKVKKRIFYTKQYLEGEKNGNNL